MALGGTSGPAASRHRGQAARDSGRKHVTLVFEKMPNPFGRNPPYPTPQLPDHSPGAAPTSTPLYLVSHRTVPCRVMVQSEYVYSSASFGQTFPDQVVRMLFARFRCFSADHPRLHDSHVVHPRHRCARAHPGRDRGAAGASTLCQHAAARSRPSSDGERDDDVDVRHVLHRVRFLHRTPRTKKCYTAMICVFASNTRESAVFSAKPT